MHSKKYTFGIIAVCLVILALAYSLSEEAIPHQNPIDTKLSLHADRPLTPSMRESDPALRHLSFDVETPNKLPFSSQLATVIKSVRSLTYPEAVMGGGERGTWLWTPLLQMTPEYIESVLSGAQENGINAIYLSLDSYLEIFAMPKGPQREASKKEFEAKLHYFIAEAAKRGIAVDAEAGWQNWAEEGHSYKAFAIVSFVKNFNRTREGGLRGFQYDVEPYLLPRYSADEESKEDVLRRFVKLVDETEVFLGESGLRFSVVVPDFFDGKDMATPDFSYNGGRDYVFGHLLSILERRAESSIIIMSYRNFAKGQDSSIEVSKNELATAGKRALNTKVIIAQETGEFPPLYITFNHTSKKYMARQIGELNAAFASHPNYGGLAFHYANSLIELK